MGETRKVELTSPKIIGHKGPVLDFEFCPFDEDLLVTCSDDRMVRVWRLPEEFDKDLLEPIQILSGHQKKVTLA